MGRRTFQRRAAFDPGSTRLPMVGGFDNNA
jgi:hypothetical protein